MNEVLRTIKTRRSIRKYLPDPLKKEQLEAIIEAGLYAPSAHNDQPWHFTVIRDREMIDRISAVSKKGMSESELDWMREMAANDKFHVFYGAPAVVVVSMRKDAMSPLVDCSAAIENMLLAAESLDIGSCWIGLARFWFAAGDEVKKLNLPAGYEPCYAVAFGYKGHRPSKALPRKENTVAWMD